MLYNIDMNITNEDATILLKIIERGDFKGNETVTVANLVQKLVFIQNTKVENKEEVA